MSKEEKCTCGCGTIIITVDDMVYSDHTSKWMKKSLTELINLLNQNKVSSKTQRHIQ